MEMIRVLDGHRRSGVGTALFSPGKRKCARAARVF